MRPDERARNTPSPRADRRRGAVRVGGGRGACPAGLRRDGAGKPFAPRRAGQFLSRQNDRRTGRQLPARGDGVLHELSVAVRGRGPHPVSRGAGRSHLPTAGRDRQPPFRTATAGSHAAGAVSSGAVVRSAQAFFDLGEASARRGGAGAGSRDRRGGGGLPNVAGRARADGAVDRPVLAPGAGQRTVGDAGPDERRGRPQGDCRRVPRSPRGVAGVRPDGPAGRAVRGKAAGLAAVGGGDRPHRRRRAGGATGGATDRHAAGRGRRIRRPCRARRAASPGGVAGPGRLRRRRRTDRRGDLGDRRHQQRAPVVRPGDHPAAARRPAGTHQPMGVQPHPAAGWARWDRGGRIGRNLVLPSGHQRERCAAGATCNRR